MDLNIIPTLCLSLLLLLLLSQVRGTTFTLVNRCEHTIWPGISANTGSPSLDTTGFELPAEASRSLTAPNGWAGKFWARTGCSFDRSGKGSCRTGDCGSGQMECSGAGAAPPSTIAGFCTGGNDVVYGVSLINCRNLPLIVETTGGTGACGLSTCAVDIGRECPPELRVDGGKFDSPACLPSVYWEMKTQCPGSYDVSFTCSGADYTLIFCPSHPS